MTMPQSVFRLVLIKPSRYDDDGYVIQWARALIPSNSLATINGLARDCAERHVLWSQVSIEITVLDESTTRIRVRRLIRELTRPGVRALVGLVGVQSNQFPRAVDLGRQFRTAGLNVCIGGFHVSGSLAMLDGVPPELQAAVDLGISLFAGEAEGRLEQVLQDAYAGHLRPIYRFLDALPDLAGAPIPYLPPAQITRTTGKETTFDAGRGCPFLCSFCTIINVQGRQSRHRSPDDIERIVRGNHANGVHHYFITDDNFSRNRSWEPIFDRLIQLPRSKGCIPSKGGSSGASIAATAARGFDENVPGSFIRDTWGSSWRRRGGSVGSTSSSDVSACVSRTTRAGRPTVTQRFRFRPSN